jgi:DNA-binding winged helix-turn-helix (wHTH) protein/tetratricopeptide (TPR) repeat protein
MALDSLTAPDSTGPGFSFGEFRLEADGTLLRGATMVHLPPKELVALRLLLAHAGQIVTPLQFRQALWGDVHVTADSVPKCLSSLRARLEPEECIQTVYKRGYRFTAEVRRDATAPAGALPRLAIMPFATAYTVPEHLGMAIAEETATCLANMRHPLVSVLARDSVFTLALRGFTAQQVGEALKADLVLTGTLRTQPSHFRLRAEMIRVEDGTQIWVEDILVAQSRISRLESELVDHLAFRLGARIPSNRGPQRRVYVDGVENRGPQRRVYVDGVENMGHQEADFAFRGEGDSSSSQGWNAGGLSISAVAAPTVDTETGSQRREAYEIYLRAHYEWQTMKRHQMQDALQDLLRATELDPSLVSAQLDIVRVCIVQAFYGYMSPAVAASQARRAAKSIPGFPGQAEPILPGLGWISFHVDHDLATALQVFSAAAHLPHDPWITRLRVMLDLSRHRFPEAIAALRAAVREDPFSPWLVARLAWALHLDGQAAASVEQINQCLALFPDHEGAALYGSMILAFNGEAARGVHLAHDLARRQPYYDLATAVHAYALACANRKDEARAILERLQWLSRERFVLSSFTPAVQVALEDPKAAIADLRAAEEARCPWFFQMLADPRLKPLHGLPEFDRMRAILTRMEASIEV